MERAAATETTLEGATSRNKRVLVTYATRAGSTAKIAAAVAETLAARGYAVDVKPVKTRPARLPAPPTWPPAALG